ncbi:MAG: NAD(P)H-dependent oxidoreductase subunit E [Anaerolineales bacterium]|nr:NAD(P)H-dependent oxidoreductase subunit E [Anaerolineales bacterium]
MTTTSTSVDLSLLTPLVEKYNGRSRTDLLPFLHEAQALYGWLPREVLETIGKTLRVPLADIHGVVEFYTMFYNEPTAKHVIRVCEDVACARAGAQQVKDAVSAKLGLQHGETSADGSITYECVTCLGMCEHAPVALNGEKPAGSLTPDNVDAFLDGTHPEPKAMPYGGPFMTLARVGHVDPTSLDAYEQNGGYDGLRKALPMAPETLIGTIEDFGILGRGGAMFPLGRKWLFTRGAPGTPAAKHVVVNADESEPGTFKDRYIMEEDPFAVIEAMTIAAYAIGAENGWIFIRGEYPRAHARLHNAVDKAREAGYLGRNILGKEGFHFDVHVRLGAGAYICGEETALFEAIEGKRGFPRIKPPFPTTNGLFNQPTAINNVETLAAMLAAFTGDKQEWNQLGTENSPGTKLFCLSGDVQRPGIYEVPFGLTIRELIAMAGGLPNGRSIQAVLMGGAAGVFIKPDQLDTQLSYGSLRQANIPLGSGVVMVFDETADLRQHLYELTRFFAHESCGKCFPCQLGTQRQMEIVERIAHNGGPKPTDKTDLLDIGFTMTETSLCGLGQTAASALLSAIDLWPELVEEARNR